MIIKHKLFSKNDNSNKESSIAKDATIAGASVVGYKVGKKGLEKAHEKAYDYLSDSRNYDENLEKKLTEEAKSLGIKIKKGNIDNSIYTGKSKLIQSGIKKYKGLVYKVLGKKGLKELDKELKYDMGIDLDTVSRMGKDQIILGKGGTLSDADVLAHELGHAKHYGKDRGGSKIGKLLHRGMAPGKMLGTKGVAIANGIRAGYQEGTKEEKGEKKNKLNRHSAWALPAIANGTVVGGETAATRQGLKSLKKAGASAKYLKKANKRLGAALGTYATLGAVPILAGEASYRVGKLAGKLNARKNKKEKSPKKED